MTFPDSSPRRSPGRAAPGIALLGLLVLLPGVELSGAQALPEKNPQAAEKPSEKTPAPLHMLQPDSGRSGKTVYISEGEIPLMVFLKFLADYTGLPVLHDSNDSTLEARKIKIASGMEGADYDLVKAILEVNGVRIYREVLPNRRAVLKIDTIRPGDLKESTPPLIRVPPGGPITRAGVPTAGTPSPSPGVSDAEKNTEKRLRDLEGKMDEVLKALHALNRRFDERLEALEREQREGVRKLMEEISDRRDAPTGRSSKAPRPGGE